MDYNDNVRIISLFVVEPVCFVYKLSASLFVVYSHEYILCLCTAFRELCYGVKGIPMFLVVLPKHQMRYKLKCASR